jgi:hypothetical protein
MENMMIIHAVELKVPVYGGSFKSTLFLASHDVDVIRPELFCVESRKSIMYYILWGFI